MLRSTLSALVATALVAGAAEGGGEVTGYYLGYSGQVILSRRRFYQRLEGWMRRRGWLVLPCGESDPASMSSGKGRTV